MLAALGAAPAQARSRAATLELCSYQAQAGSIQVVLEDPNVAEVSRSEVQFSEMAEVDGFAPVFKVDVTAALRDGTRGSFTFRVRTLYRNSVCRFVSLDRLSQIDFGPDHPCDAVKESSLKEFCMAEQTQDRERCRSIGDDNWKSFCLRRSVGDSYSCEEIRDESFRYYCYALTRQSAIPCFQIPSRDMGKLCFGHVQKDAGFCGDIVDPNLRQLCVGLQKPMAAN
jgi:hypothetical protein